jgi:predicted permease
VLLLLIACGNVANLLLARAVCRSREIAMREALGAGGWRLLRQLLTENLTLCIAGGVAGIATALAILRSLPLFLPAGTPRLDETGLGPAIFFFAGLAMMLTLVLFGVAPAVVMRNRTRGSALGRATTVSVRDSRLSLALVGGELAVATALLIGAALMARTLWQLDRVEAGIRTAGVVSARISMGPSRCATHERCLATLDAVGRTLLALPAAQSVNWANFAPLEKKISAASVEIQDHLRPPGAPAYVLWETAATPGYFQSLGIRLLQGRLFSDGDRTGTAPVVLISESTARRYWPNESPIGKQIRPVANRDWRSVVGVVSDVKQYSLTGFPPWIDGVQYVPLGQVLPRVTRSMQLTVLVESRDPRAAASALARAVQSQFTGIAVSGVSTLDAVRRDSMAEQSSTAALLVLFAGIGLLLGVSGVHGVVSHRVAQRTRDIGIRMALGATGGRVVCEVVREMAVVAMIGLTAGGVAAFASTRILRALLFGVTHHDPLAFAVCPALLLAAALMAACVPAILASRTDPAETLREG